MTDEPVLNEWQTETKTIDVMVPEAAFDDQGRLKDVRMVKGKREVSEKVMYQKLIPQAFCGPTRHDFALLPHRVAGRLLVKCHNCQQGRQLILGRETLINGQLKRVERR